MARPGATACSHCPRGYETRDTGNTECSPCAAGYFHKAAYTDDTYTTNSGSTVSACKPAPAGTYVNTTAAYFTTPW